ncbi:MAG: gamma-glutamyl-gamma-aminobutyrate hydrolase family protein [Marmoricola sp.]
MTAHGAPPLVGISTYRERARWGVWDVPADVLPADYARSLEASGAAVVLLPPQHPSLAARVVEGLDALVVSGGADVDPARYGEQPGPHTSGWRPDRDAWELSLLDGAAARGLPTLMICRAMQLEAVRAGGSLVQHTPHLVGDLRHAPGGDRYGAVEVTTLPGSRLAGLVGPGLSVRCHHHQSVRDHPGLVAVARAADGTVEALEDASRRFWVAVQWHPETQADSGLFAGLVTAARPDGRERRPGRGPA